MLGLFKFKTRPLVNNEVNLSGCNGFQIVLISNRLQAKDMCTGKLICLIEGYQKSSTVGAE